MLLSAVSQDEEVLEFEMLCVWMVTLVIVKLPRGSPISGIMKWLFAIEKALRLPQHYLRQNARLASFAHQFFAYIHSMLPDHGVSGIVLFYVGSIQEDTSGAWLGFTRWCFLVCVCDLHIKFCAVVTINNRFVLRLLQVSWQCGKLLVECNSPKNTVSQFQSGLPNCLHVSFQTGMQQQELQNCAI